MTKVIVDSVIISIGDKSQIYNTLYLLIIELAITLFTFILSQIENLVKIKAENEIQYSTDELLLNKCSNLPLIYFETPENYNLLKRAFSSSGGKGIKIIYSVFTILQNVVTLLGFTLVLFQIHWILFFSLFLLLVVYMVVTIQFGNKQYAQTVEMSENNRRQSYLSELLRSKDSIKELKIFKHSEYLIKKWTKYFWISKDEEYKLHTLNATNQAGLELFKSFLNFGFLGLLLWIVIERKLTVGDYVSLSMTLSSTLVIMQVIANQMAITYTTAPYIRDFLSFLEIKEEPKKILRLEKNMLQQSIEIENICFSYPSSGEVLS